MIKPLLVLGGGGHARVIIEILVSRCLVIEAVIAPELRQAPEFKGLKHLRADDDIKRYEPDVVMLVNAIGSLPNQNNLREILFNNFKAMGYNFSSAISKMATVSRYAEFAEGVQILPSAVVNSCQIGANTIINTGAIIEHDVKIGNHCHIAPGAIICGNVSVGNNVHIGAGATVIQGINISDGAIVGAGSIVTESLPSKAIQYPAKPFIRKGND